MGLWKNIKRAVTKATRIIPPLAVMVPIGGKEQRKNAVEGLKTGAAIGSVVTAGKGLVPTNATAAPAINPATGEFTDAYLSTPGGGGTGGFNLNGWILNGGSQILGAMGATAPELMPGGPAPAPVENSLAMPLPDYPYSMSYVPEPVQARPDNSWVLPVLALAGVALILVKR